MRNLIRSPLSWMVLAELVVVTTLIVLAWSALASSVVRPAAAAPAVSASNSGAGVSSPTPELPVFTGPEAKRPQPGLNLDPAFWLGRLQSLNRDQVFFEQLQWRLLHTASDAAQRYLETVVLPSVQKAER
ncbi:MAG TPA: hypothetical protein VJT78_02810 [Candidatus Dormibacteraeota bacterium]|nr:hypothetical protein [Candidatus Dormibacteraeota bacterium]